MSTSESTNPNPLRSGMPAEFEVDPCALVIFGASGDLTARKLLPSIFSLAQNRFLPSAFALVGFARRDYSHDKFRQLMREALDEHFKGDVDGTAWDDLSAGISYVRGGFDDADAYQALARELERLDRERGTAGGRTFYLAVPPSSVAGIVGQLKRAGLCEPSQPGGPLPRFVVEKPFGVDLSSARELNRQLLSELSEAQIYRIDHYLGKETVQNLLVLRFGNTIFEPLWNRNHVSHVELTVAEHIGIEGRGKFYEQTGLMRDIVQNHALQLLALVAMEAPAAWDANAVRNEKVKALAALRPLDKLKDLRERSVRAQYLAGVVRGDSVRGYRDEPDVAPQSQVETYVALDIAVDNWRWGGVPFFLRAGKRLQKRVTEITLHFKPVPHPLFTRAIGRDDQPNALTLRIQPDEGIALSFATKIPGQSLSMREVSMDFKYGTAFGHKSPDAYERLLLDAMRGDATLFTRDDEVDAQWAFVDPIMAAWQQNDVPLAGYSAGSWGPREADDLIERHGQRWSSP